MSATTWIFPHQGWSGCFCWVPNMSTTETKAELPIWQHSLGGPASHLVASWLHWTPSILEGAAIFFSLEEMHNMDMGLSSPSAVCLPAPPSVNLLNALFTVLVSHNIFILTKEFYFVAKIINQKNVRERVLLMGVTCLIVSLIYSETRCSKYSKLVIHVLYHLSHCQNI